MTGQTAKFLPKAINNVHQAAAQALEALDPRFRVETSYLSGVSTIGLRPREPIEFSMTVPPEHAEEWQLALLNLEMHASPARLPMHGVSVTGSPILEAAFGASRGNPGGSLSIVPRSMPAAVKLVLHDPVREQAFPFDDVLGTVYVGEASARFVGWCCDDMVRVTLGIPVAEMDKGVTITVELNLCIWEGMDASRLPHFEKLDRLCSALGNGWVTTLNMEVRGNQSIHGTLQSAVACDYYRGLANYMGYVRRARALASHLGAKLPLKSELFSREDHERLDQVVSIFEGRHVFDRQQLQSEPVTHLVAGKDAENIRQLIRDPDGHDIHCELAAQELTVFGTQIALPPIEVEITGVRARVDLDLVTVKEGDVVPVTWDPGEDFRCVYRFVGASKAPQNTESPGAAASGEDRDAQA